MDGLKLIKDDFLLKEFECCYEQLRYYDTRQASLLSFLFSLTSAVATAQFAIYKLSKSFNQGWFACNGFLSFIVFVATILIFCAMLQNRLYFVYVARQINSIRKYYVSTIPEFNNQLYISTNFPAFKLFSIHTFKLLGVSFVSSIFAASSFYSIGLSMGKATHIWYAMGVSLFVLIVELVLGCLYLYILGRKSADSAIHKL